MARYKQKKDWIFNAECELLTKRDYAQGESICVLTSDYMTYAQDCIQQVKTPGRFAHKSTQNRAQGSNERESEVDVQIIMYPVKITKRCDYCEIELTETNTKNGATHCFRCLGVTLED